MNLIHGEAVTVIRPTTESDELGEPIEGEPIREAVENVIVVPGATVELDASRPNGATVAFTLCFPKGYGRSLKGCSVEVRGRAYEVIGDPQPYTEENTPGYWNLTVEVTRTDG